MSPSTSFDRKELRMATEPLTLLLAEDDEGHAELTRLNMSRAGVVNEIIHVLNGQEALDYVRHEGAHMDRKRSSLVILLDINMPRLDGIETLRQLKADPKTAVIPVIMLTTTDDPRDVERCYQLGCNVYITKPLEYEQFCEALRRLGMLLQFVRVPLDD
jgi:CheY-like chemotaxis protein